MKILLKAVLSLGLIYTIQSTLAQNVKDSLDLVYHLDPILYNGKQYTYFVSSNMMGNQYFMNRDFSKGNVQINGVIYPDLDLNYDIFNQQLLLKFIKPNGITSIVVIPKASLDIFNIKHNRFEVFKTKNKSEQIYQVIGKDSIQVLYSWKKRLNLDDASGISTFIFSESEKDTYVHINNQIKKYRNNKSFVSLFDSNKQKKIKKYIQEKNINVKKAPDKQMIDLIAICNKDDF
ncbi:MAG: hypothetical protein DRI95_13470 [Bacteroidetes bacterium]|nr:MAG: hypothetical protein DRI95_13470 [Bacteroidota bacterium]RLD73606.1 MAG: hypothetical protein DRJ07_20605 [Bacteroidota bacterium]